MKETAEINTKTLSEQITQLSQTMMINFDIVHRDIKIMKGDIFELKTDVKILKEDVAVLKEDVKVLKEDVAILKEDVKVLKEDVYLLKLDVSQLKKDVRSLEKKVLDIREDTTFIIDICREKFTLHDNRISRLELATTH